MIDSTWQFSRHWAHVLRLGGRLRSFAWARRLLRVGLTGGNFQVDADGRLVLGELGISIESGTQEVLLEGYGHALAARQAGVRFSAEGERLFATVGTVRSEIKTFDDLFILKEIYAEGAYAISGSGELLLFDVGMNVGHASLYFASRFPRAVVLGFEPFKPTFDRALANFANNPLLAGRIRPFNFGLAAADGDLEVEFDPVIPGRMGLFGIPADVAASSARGREHVQLRDVLTVLDEAMATHPNRKVIMKVDCEGAEYEIITRLHESGRLSEVDVLAIEWHRKAADHDPGRLEAMMAKSGFTVLSQGSRSGPAGMMYGVNVTARVRCEAMVAP